MRDFTSISNEIIYYGKISDYLSSLKIFPVESIASFICSFLKNNSKNFENYLNYLFFIFSFLKNCISIKIINSFFVKILYFFQDIINAKN